MEATRHFSIIIKGRVQGVGYRAFALKTANKLGIKGFVKNRNDGVVLIEAEGTIDRLEQYLKICEVGPGWAHVDSLVKCESPVEGFGNFTIKY